jgi:bifunctional non-homologous end joining protein LigD
VTTHHVDGRTVEITNPDRVLFPADGLTKADLVEYHLAVAPTLVAHLAERPLMLQRFPEGIGGAGFYQKEAGRGVASWIPTVTVTKDGGTVHHPLVGDTAALLALTNLSTVSFHRWPSRVDRLDRPDLLVVDLDPSGDDVDEVRRAARRARVLFDELDLPAHLQVTGSSGVHVVTPLDRSADTETVATFAHDLARVLAARHPETLTDAFRKADRRGRIFVATAQTVIAPYSVRPRPRAPVATPITWDELDDPAVGPDTFTVATVPDRLGRHGDPWADLRRRGRSIATRRDALNALLVDADRSGPR